MSNVVCDITISADGFVAGSEQSLEHPLGVGGERLHTWMQDSTPEQQEQIDRHLSAGAYVMGRNMFGPIRGEWTGDWQGWWGEDPPYHTPVFVLTHHPRPPLTMKGGTTFTFVTEGIEAALAHARAAAADRDVSIAGGAETINQYLRAGLIDELRVHLMPLTLGAGERLFAGVPPLDFEIRSVRCTPQITHLTYLARGEAKP